MSETDKKIDNVWDAVLHLSHAVTQIQNQIMLLRNNASLPSKAEADFSESFNLYVNELQKIIAMATEQTDGRS